MKETYSNGFFLQKAYELNYALFRVAANTRVSHPALADRLEKKALDLLEGALSADSGGFPGVREALSAIHYLVLVGGDTGAINQLHARSIIDEANKFNSAIETWDNSEKTENPAEIFSEWNQENPAEKFSLPDFNETPNTVNGADNIEADGATERHLVILERIRQNGNCRMKEIQELLPNVSERTIRYDLQKLLERGLVERIGNSGPATFYQARTEKAPL